MCWLSAVPQLCVKPMQSTPRNLHFAVSASYDLCCWVIVRMCDLCDVEFTPFGSFRFWENGRESLLLYMQSIPGTQVISSFAFGPIVFVFIYFTCELSTDQIYIVEIV